MPSSNSPKRSLSCDGPFVSDEAWTRAADRQDEFSERDRQALVMLGGRVEEATATVERHARAVARIFSTHAAWVNERVAVALESFPASQREDVDRLLGPSDADFAAQAVRRFESVAEQAPAERQQIRQKLEPLRQAGPVSTDWSHDFTCTLLGGAVIAEIAIAPKTGGASLLLAAALAATAHDRRPGVPSACIYHFDVPETRYAPRESKAEHEAYFSRELALVDAFWARFQEVPDVRGARVLDLGCGHGALCVAIARGGAAEVAGVDLDEDRTRFASSHVAANYPELRHCVSFRNADVADVAAERSGTFDLAVCKDTMEHVQDLDHVLVAVRRLLKPGGRFWIGFSPLWGSPKGDHGRTGLRVPWAHAVLPHDLVMRSAARHRGHPVREIGDIGLNGFGPSTFLEAFDRAGFEVQRIAYNRSEKRLVRALGRVRHLGPIERFATVGMYAILRRPPDQIDLSPEPPDSKR